MKIKKNVQRKCFRFNVNRKRVKKNRLSTGKVKCADVKHFWEDTKFPTKNFYEMGLSMDPNKTIPLDNMKQNRIKMARIVNGFIEEEEDDELQLPEIVRPKRFVAEQLEKDANTLRESKLRLPKGVVSHLSYFLDKYQLNYKAMVRDRRNYDQFTWKQFRAKIRTLRSIPQQFCKYLSDKNLSDQDVQQWKECTSDDE